MSRSYRRPYGTCVMYRSAKQDKQMANRAVRRQANVWLKITEDFEEALIPHRYECAHNEVWGWSRDGKQTYQVPGARQWSSHVAKLSGYAPYSNWPYTRFPYMLGDLSWPPKWYLEILRK